MTDALNGLKELELSYSQGTSGHLWGSQITLSSGEISLMTLNSVIDENTGDFYAKIPELSPGLFDVGGGRYGGSVWRRSPGGIF